MKQGNLPKSIGIILDGNRRFAKRLMKEPWKGHEYGAKKLEKLFDWCRELNIKELILYCFSIENFNRPKLEFDFLMKLFEKEFTKYLKDKRIDQYKIRINFIGRLDMFPLKLQQCIKKLQEKTKEYNNYIVNFAMAYGGRAEIVDAVKKIADKVKNNQLSIDSINEDTIKENLYLQSEPDLVIRTSESRLSGFLLWQASYAELIFLPNLLWPEFTKKHFIKCINEYSRRQRRFGK